MKLITKQVKQAINEIKLQKNNLPPIGKMLSSAVIDGKRDVYCHFVTSKYYKELAEYKPQISKELASKLQLNSVFITISTKDENIKKQVILKTPYLFLLAKVVLVNLL